MADPATITLVIKAAAAVATDKNTRKIIGGVVIAVLSPFILAIAVIMGIFGGGSSHNSAAVQFAYNGGDIPADAPAEYREYMDSLRNSFAGLEVAISEINSISEDGSLDSARVKAIFYSLYFGRENLTFDDGFYRRFADCFVRYEERTRTDGEVTETYTVAIPLVSLSEIYTNLEVMLGRAITPDEGANAQNVYNNMLYGDNIVTDNYNPDGYWSSGLDDGEIQYLGDGASTQVVYFNQADSRWGRELYGRSGTIAATACGPTSLAMVVSTMTSRIIDPLEMSRWAYSNGYCAESKGSYHSLIPEGGRHFGLNVEGATYREGRKVVDALASGKLVIAIMSRGHFTNGGHFIILRGITSSGEVLVADPASYRRSEQVWPLSIILNEVRKDAAAGGAFWIFSNGN